jgi:formyl-CoA transferase
MWIAMTSGTYSVDSSGGPPLRGVRVLELGNFIAAPTTGRLLGEFGAEVIKIEQPRVGDQVRHWRLSRGETSMMWRTLGRNKKSVTIDIRTAEGADLVRRLAARTDVLVENYRPGKLESWGLSPPVLREHNPRLVLVRISGYGQTGPYRDRPGFGGVAEAMGGLRHVTGFPGQPPVRPNLSIGDTIASLHGVMGALLALREAEKSGKGQVVDVALYESVFNCSESLLPEYDAGGYVRERSGSTLPGIAPSNLYPCKDGTYVLIAGNADSLYRRLMSAIGREDLRDDPALARNDGRAAQMERIDEAIGKWTLQRTQKQVLDEMEKAEVPAGKIYSAADIAADPHYAARGMIQSIVAGDGEPLKVPGIVPKLSATPGAIRSAAPKLGEHTDEVLLDMGFSKLQIDEWKEKRIV